MLSRNKAAELQALGRHCTPPSAPQIHVAGQAVRAAEALRAAVGGAEVSRLLAAGEVVTDPVRNVSVGRPPVLRAKHGVAGRLVVRVTEYGTPPAAAIIAANIAAPGHIRARRRVITSSFRQECLLFNSEEIIAFASVYRDASPYRRIRPSR